jgi:LPP20 lipoprotein
MTSVEYFSPWQAAKAGARKGSAWALMVAVAGLAGCGHLNMGAALRSPQPTAVVPDWMVSPPPDTPSAMYGVGEGLDVGTATRLGLRDVAAKLRVSVSGSVKNQVSESNGQVDAQASSSLMSDIQKTEFRQYTLEKSAPSPNGVYALVRVDRVAFLSDTRERIQRLNRLSSQTVAEASAGNALDKYLALQRARNLLVAQQGLFMLFKSGDLSPADLKLQSGVQQQLLDAEGAAAKVSLNVNAANEDDDLRTVLLGVVADQSLKVNDKRGGAPGVLDVVAPMQVSQFGQDTIVRLQVRLSLKDARGVVLASRERLVTGASRTDTRMARQQAIANLRKQWQSEGLLLALGIQPLSAQGSQP